MSAVCVMHLKIHILKNGPMAKARVSNKEGHKKKKRNEEHNKRLNEK